MECRTGGLGSPESAQRMISPWSLPGPSNYFSCLLDELREGQNLIIPTPATGPIGIASELDGLLCKEGWQTSSLRCDGCSLPLDQLFDSLSIDEKRGSPRSVAKLRQMLSFGQVVIVDGVGSQSWDAWRDFLIEYEVASRGVSSFDRTLFAVIVRGIPMVRMPDQAVALKSVPWRDVVGEIDMRLYVHEALRERRPHSTWTRLLTQVIVKIALWDFELADFLIEADSKELFDPKVLLEMAMTMPNKAIVLFGDWESGGIQHFDGVEMKHSYLLVADFEGQSEIRMRLWAAQASEMLPTIELQRRALALRMRDHLPMPIRLNDENVKDLNDVEIGTLAFLACKYNLRNSIIQAANRLRRFRNKLAHLEPLNADEALELNSH